MFDLKYLKEAEFNLKLAQKTVEIEMNHAVNVYLKVKIGDRIMGSCGYTSKPVQFQVKRITSRFDDGQINVTLSGPVVNKDGSLASVKKGYEYVTIVDGADAVRFSEEQS